MKDISKLSQDISKWTGKIDLKVIQAVEDTAKDVYIDIMQLAPENTGKYKESIYIDSTKLEKNKVSVSIKTDMVVSTKSTGKQYNLGRLLEEGTVPHLIRPVEASTLHFYIDGEEVFTKLVHHPGTIEQPHFIPALMKNKRNFKRKLKLAVKEAKK